METKLPFGKRTMHIFYHCQTRAVFPEPVTMNDAGRGMKKSLKKISISIMIKAKL